MPHTSPLLCVMGVAGAGKSTFGRALADDLKIPFLDADDLHPEANLAKMSSGTPLDDEDRWAWLDLVGGSFETHAEFGLVVACSALRRAYRDRIRAVAPRVLFVHLDGSRELLATRVGERSNHFMPPRLLDSQFTTLEVLQPGEAGLIVDVAVEIDDLVADVAGRVRAAGF